MFLRLLLFLSRMVQTAGRSHSSLQQEYDTLAVYLLFRHFFFFKDSPGRSFKVAIVALLLVLILALVLLLRNRGGDRNMYSPIA